MAVCGSVEDRHGIVLAKNQLAKSLGVTTGEVLWQARKKCGGNLVSVVADFPSYYRVSRAVREIYGRFTDHIEPFGIDECWLDVTDSVKNFGNGEHIANQIRQMVKDEIGVTVSVGVSFNKVFAKLGSDIKKPDAVTSITLDNYKDTVWKLPVEDLLYVGKSTKNKLNSIGIHSIGDLASTDKTVLKNLLGVWGDTLYQYANGFDQTPVSEKKSDSDYTVSYDITNVSDVDAKEISQVYVKDVIASVLRPEKELKAYSKDYIKAGETKRISLSLNARAFSYYSVALDEWTVENGDFVIMVGASSRDIRLTKKIQIKMGEID